MGKKPSQNNDFNLNAIINEAENSSSKFKKEVRKYLTIKSKIMAAEARLPAREEPPWTPDEPPENPCAERIVVEKLKKELAKEADKIKIKWEKTIE